jgi:predicted RNA binding protein YcfA (HicA-like mRNA interferase family)
MTPLSPISLPQCEVNSFSILTLESTVDSSSASSQSTCISDNEFPPEFKAVLKRLFEKWNLDTEICLFDLLYLDTSKRLLELKNNFFQLEFNELFKAIDLALAFCFSTGSIHFWTEGYVKKKKKHEIFKNLLMYEKYDDMSRQIKNSLMKFEELKVLLIRFLQNFPLNSNSKLSTNGKKKLALIHLSKKSILSKLIKEIEENLNFIKFLWKQPNYCSLLIENNVKFLYQDSKAIEKFDWKTNLDHLTQLIGFYLKILGDLRGGISKECDEMTYKKILEIIKNSKDFHPEILKQISLVIFEQSCSVCCLELNVLHNLDLVADDKLNYQEWCAKNKLEAPRLLSHVEFCNLLIFQASSIATIWRWTADIFRMLNVQVVQLKYPNNHPIPNVFFERFIYFLTFVPSEDEKKTSQKNPQLPITPNFEKELSKLKNKIKNLSQQFFNSLNDNWPHQSYILFFLKMLAFHKANPNLTYLWNNILNEFRKSIFFLHEKVLPAFIIIKERIYNSVKHILEQIDSEECDLSAINFIQALREICLEEFYFLLPKIYFLQDALLYLKFSETDPEKLNSEDHLYPEEILGFFELDKLEEILEEVQNTKVSIVDTLQAESSDDLELSDDPSNMPEYLKDLQKEYTIPKEKISPSDSLFEFSFQKNTKVRKVIKRLESLGFIHKRTRGSHMQFKHPSGESITVPNHSTLALGTARSIERKVK